MDPKRLDRLRHRLAATGDGAIGTLAVARGWITQIQFQEALRLQKSTHKGQGIGAILVERKFLTPEQLNELVLSK